MTNGQKLGIGLAALGAILLALLHRKGLLHESVSIKVGGVPISPQGTIPPDPITGAPQFDSTIPATVPEQEAFAIPPIDGNGNVTFDVTNPKGASCPIGYQLWKDAASGRYECLPSR
jgi:hypothetical protein